MNLQEPKDLKNTVGVSARRFEESPFIARYDGPALVRGVYAGRYHALYNGEDVTRAYWVLRRQAALFDTPEKPVEISGPGAEPFLDKIFARRVAGMKEGRGRYAVACTPGGGVFMDGILFKLAPGRFWYVQADGAFETWLMAHDEGFDVTVSDPRSRVLQIQGPASLKIMSAASGGRIDESLKYFHSGFFELGGQRVYVSRTGFTGELGYEIYGFGDETDHLALWDHLAAAGAPHGMEFATSAPMTVRRIEAGILGNITDMDPSMTPFEAGLEALVDMDKGGFIGRAALENADRRPVLTGLTCADAVPSAGAEVLDGGAPVGRMRSGVYSPTLECGIGYVQFNEPGDWRGRILELRISETETRPCEIVDLPFFDAEKKLPKGLA
ncbi:MAG: aminomethyltransferase family protein [Rhodospirillales bacterium]